MTWTIIFFSTRTGFAEIYFVGSLWCWLETIWMEVPQSSEVYSLQEANLHGRWESSTLEIPTSINSSGCCSWGRNCRGGVHYQNDWWLCYIVDDGFHENLWDHIFLRTLILSLPLRSRVLGLSFTQAMYLGSWRFQGLGFTGIIQDLKSPKGNPFKSRFPKGSCEFLFFCWRSIARELLRMVCFWMFELASPSSKAGCVVDIRFDGLE